MQQMLETHKYSLLKVGIEIQRDLVRNRFDSYWRWYHGVAVLRLFSEVYIRAVTILQLDDVEYEDWRRR